MNANSTLKSGLDAAIKPNPQSEGIYTVDEAVNNGLPTRTFVPARYVNVKDAYKNKHFDRVFKPKELDHLTHVAHAAIAFETSGHIKVAKAFKNTKARANKIAKLRRPITLNDFVPQELKVVPQPPKAQNYGFNINAPVFVPKAKMMAQFSLFTLNSNPANEVNSDNSDSETCVQEIAPHPEKREDSLPVQLVFREDTNIVATLQPNEKQQPFERYEDVRKWHPLSTSTPPVNKYYVEPEKVVFGYASVTPTEVYDPTYPKFTFPYRSKVFNKAMGDAGDDPHYAFPDAFPPLVLYTPDHVNETVTVLDTMPLHQNNAHYLIPVGTYHGEKRYFKLLLPNNLEHVHPPALWQLYYQMKDRELTDEDVAATVSFPNQYVAQCGPGPSTGQPQINDDDEFVYKDYVNPLVLGLYNHFEYIETPVSNPDYWGVLVLGYKSSTDQWEAADELLFRVSDSRFVPRNQYPPNLKYGSSFVSAVDLPKRQQPDDPDQDNNPTKYVAHMFPH